MYKSIKQRTEERLTGGCYDTNEVGRRLKANEIVQREETM
jgi:hypothetical protein